MKINIDTKFNIGDRVQLIGHPKLRGKIDTIKVSKFRDCEIVVRYLFDIVEADEREIELVKNKYK